MGRRRARGLEGWTGARVAALIAILTGALHLLTELRAAFGGQPSLLDRLEMLALDAKLAARGPRPPKRWGVVVAAVDEPSLERFGPLPWTRRRHAEVVRALAELGAGAIAFDMTFERPERDPVDELRARLGPGLDAELRAALDALGPDGGSADEALARAARASERVVLGGVALSRAEARSLEGSGARSLEVSLQRVRGSLVRELVVDADDGLSRVLDPDGSFAGGAYRRYFGLTVPTATLAESAAAFAALNAAPDPDGVHRGLPAVVAFAGQDVLLPTLALQAVAVARGAPVELLGDPAAPIADAVRVGGPPIQLGLGGRVLLDWYGGFHRGEMPRFSIAALLDGAVPRSAVEGRVVFVAATAVGTHDQRVTPLERAVPGVYIHATLAQHLLDGRHLARPPWLIGLELLVIAGLGLITAGGLARLDMRARVGGSVGLAAGWLLVDQVVLLEAGLAARTLLPVGQIALTLIAMSLHGFYAERRERKRTRSAFGRYLSPRVMEQVLADPERHLRLGGERKTATVLFSDIRGFTSISERLDPETLGRLLNRYMTPMTRRVFALEGTLDKYMGDALMAFWGAPLAQPDHALRACRAALGMLQDLEAVNADLAAEGLPALRIGVGIASGEMTIGNMGSEEFFAYTALGDRVNLGARLEGQTKAYGVTIIVSEATRAAAGDALLFRELDMLRVKGKQTPERIFELLGERASAGALVPFVDAFHGALAAFRARRFAEAAERFVEAAELRGGDACAERYAERSRAHAASPPPDHWDGVREATSK